MARKNVSQNTAKLPRRVTVSDLLTGDNVNAVLGDLEKHKHEIQDLIVIYTDKSGQIYSDHTEDTLASLAVYMLEQHKNGILNGWRTEDEE